MVMQGKNTTNTVVLVSILTWQKRKLTFENRGSDSFCPPKQVTLLNAKNIILPEIVNCGVYDSRFRFKNVDYSKSRTVSVFELELPLEESGVSYINNTPHPVSLQNFIIAKPGNVRYSKLHYKCFYIHMTAEQGELYDLLMNLPVVVHISNREKYISVFEELISANDSPYSENSLLVSAKLLELLYMLKKDAAVLTASLEGKSNSEAIKKAIEFINANFQHEITLEDVAESVHLRRIYFHNLFKSAVGQTVHRYILNKRMENAKHHLLTSSDSIGTIAMISGFSSQSYFNYIFRKETGLTPGKYKEKMSRDYII